MSPSHAASAAGPVRHGRAYARRRPGYARVTVRVTIGTSHGVRDMVSCPSIRKAPSRTERPTLKSRQLFSEPRSPACWAAASSGAGLARRPRGSDCGPALQWPSPEPGRASVARARRRCRREHRRDNAGLRLSKAGERNALLLVPTGTPRRDSSGRPRAGIAPNETPESVTSPRFTLPHPPSRSSPAPFTVISPGFWPLRVPRPAEGSLRRRVRGPGPGAGGRGRGGGRRAGPGGGPYSR